MKKVLLVLALVAVYGISISTASAKVIIIEKSNVTIVADSDDNSVISLEKEEKVKKGAKGTTAKNAAPAKACCGEKPATTEKAAEKAGCSEAAKKSCAASGTSCGGEKK